MTNLLLCAASEVLHGKPPNIAQTMSRYTTPEPNGISERSEEGNSRSAARGTETAGCAGVCLFRGRVAQLLPVERAACVGAKARGGGAADLGGRRDIHGDPCKVPTARLIPVISPARGGGRGHVLRQRGNTPEDPHEADTGDESADARKQYPHHPTAVTMKERIVVLNLNSNRKSVSHGFLAGIFGTLERFGVVVDLNNTSEVHVSMAIEDGGEEADGAPAEGAAEERDVELLAAVEYPAGRVNIEMISQGASEINISCVIDARDTVKALNLIHRSCLQLREGGMVGRSVAVTP
ncbi:hypothetical protein C8J57DRAFT_1721939 [Mycena rebaudengoi]|nr:hypothetical protein C8J57DRAFT_1721939 [Mycena rebaudengoi]